MQVLFILLMLIFLPQSVFAAKEFDYVLEFADDGTGLIMVDDDLYEICTA